MSLGLVPRDGPRVRLRPFDRDDAAFLLRLFRDPSYVANIHDKGIHTVDEARAWLSGTLFPAYETHGYGMSAIVPHGAVEPVGMCGLVRRTWLPGPDLGYALLSSATGHGYAREAARLALEGARELGLTRVLAIVDPTNTRSLRLLAALGFEDVGSCALPDEDVVLRTHAVDLSRRDAT